MDEPNDRPEIRALSREQRQLIVTDWCRRAFASESQENRGKRVLRFFEEAMELFQAEGGSREQVEALLDRVFARPAGDPGQEVGGVSVTLLSYCSAAGLSADECEAAEIERVLARPLENARRRYAEKSRAGL